jgi:hypothetical protein
VIHNWKVQADDGDMSLVDGYEELPAVVQEKVKRAFDQGHVDDDDFSGVGLHQPQLLADYANTFHDRTWK